MQKEVSECVAQVPGANASQAEYGPTGPTAPEPINFVSLDAIPAGHPLSANQVACLRGEISSTGMPITTDRSRPIGAERGFELTPP